MIENKTPIETLKPKPIENENNVKNQVLEKDSSVKRNKTRDKTEIKLFTHLSATKSHSLEAKLDDCLVFFEAVLERETNIRECLMQQTNDTNTATVEMNLEQMNMEMSIWISKLMSWLSQLG